MQEAVQYLCTDKLTIMPSITSKTCPVLMQGGAFIPTQMSYTEPAIFELLHKHVAVVKV